MLHHSLHVDEGPYNENDAMNSINTSRLVVNLHPTKYVDLQILFFLQFEVTKFYVIIHNVLINFTMD